MISNRKQQNKRTIETIRNSHNQKENVRCENRDQWKHRQQSDRQNPSRKTSTPTQMHTNTTTDKMYRYWNRE